MPRHDSDPSQTQLITCTQEAPGLFRATYGGLALEIRRVAPVHSEPWRGVVAAIGHEARHRVRRDAVNEAVRAAERARSAGQGIARACGGQRHGAVLPGLVGAVAT